MEHRVHTSPGRSAWPGTGWKCEAGLLRETPGLLPRGVCCGGGEFQTTGHNSRLLKTGQHLSESVIGLTSPVTYSTLLKSKFIFFFFFLTASKGFGEDSDHLRLCSALLWFMVLTGNRVYHPNICLFSLDIN